MKSPFQFTVAKVFKALGMTALALLLSMFMMQPFAFSTTALLSSHEKKDFKITDFYNIVAESRAVRQLDDNVVIVNIDNADRADIASLIDQLALYEPAAIGLDVTFDSPRDSVIDDYLISVIESSPRIVQAVTVNPLGDSARPDCFTVSERSFFMDSASLSTPGCPSPAVGAVNLPMKMAGGVAREFAVKYPTPDSFLVIPSFPAALAAMVDSAAHADLLARGNDLETIYYPSRIYREWDAADVDLHADEIRGRVVLIGALDDLGDKHASPLGHSISGVEIHARALSTILDRNYVTATPGWFNILAGAIVTFLFLLLYVTFVVSWKAIVLRILQVVVLYLILVVSYRLFIGSNILVDFSFTFLMVTFGLFAFDIWTGGEALVEYICKKLSGRRS